jgi:pyrroline-5-carboxylate reductase
MPSPLAITIIGAGNLGKSLIAGLLDARLSGRENLRATVAPDEDPSVVSERFGVRCTAGGNVEAVLGADVIVIAVKPPHVAPVIAEIRDGLGAGQMIISFAAAVPISLIEGALGKPMPVFRAMPNIAMTVRESATALCSNSRVNADQRKLAEEIFRTVGTVCWVDEPKMHAVTGLSGSGPAYVCLLIEGLIAGGIDAGLPHAVARELAQQTILGAAKLCRDSGEHPAALRDKVTTPGGTTIAGLRALESGGVRAALMAAVEAATRRSMELSSALGDSGKK